MKIQKEKKKRIEIPLIKEGEKYPIESPLGDYLPPLSEGESPWQGASVWVHQHPWKVEQKQNL